MLLIRAFKKIVQLRTLLLMSLGMSIGGAVVLNLSSLTSLIDKIA